MARNILAKVPDNLVQTLATGKGSKDAAYDMVQWRERHWNIVADDLANNAMDFRRDSLWWSDVWLGEDINIMVFADGGRRGSGIVALASAVVAIREGHHKLIGTGAVVTEGIDSFVPECRSMELVTAEVLKKLTVHRKPPNENC